MPQIEDAPRSTPLDDPPALNRDEIHNPVQAAHDINNITRGTVIHHITNLDLAVCLLTVGVPLREDPPFTHTKLCNGEEKWVFNFEGKTADGEEKTTDLIEAFRLDMKYVNEHPHDPFTFAMCALKNLARIKDVMRRSKPWVGFKNKGGSAVLLVIEGSQKYQNCLRRGMIQVDPFADQKNRG